MITVKAAQTAAYEEGAHDPTVIERPVYFLYHHEYLEDERQDPDVEGCSYTIEQDCGLRGVMVKKVMGKGATARIS